MTTNTYQEHHLKLIQALLNAAQQSPRLNDEALLDEADQEFINNLQKLSQNTGINEEFIALGQSTLSRIVARYPELTPHAHRDLFWLFGGDCLHYMPDDEIQIYQRLDERRFEQEAAGEPFNFTEERARIFGLH